MCVPVVCFVTKIQQRRTLFFYYARRDGWDELPTQASVTQHYGQPARIKPTSIGQRKGLINYDIHRDLKSLCKISYVWVFITCFES